MPTTTPGYGFNAGSALLLTAAESTGKVAALVAVNTSLAAGAGAISALATNLYLLERKTGEFSFDLSVAMNGALAGLVAITAPCGTVENWAAVCVGIVAGWVYLAGSELLLRLKLDDAVDAIPVHMFNGIWGLLATGLFSSPGRLLDAFGTDEHVGFFYSLGQGSVDGTLLLLEFITIIFVIGWASATMLPFFMWLNYMGWFRADSLEELVGLDMSYHGGVQAETDGPGAEEMKAFSDKKSALRRRPAESMSEEAQSWDEMTASGPPESAPRRSRRTEQDDESKESGQ